MEPIQSTPQPTQGTNQFGVRNDPYPVEYARKPKPKEPVPVDKPIDTPLPAAASATTESVRSTTENSVTPGQGEPLSLSAGAAALARKEQLLRKQQLEMKQRLDSVEAEKKELEELRQLKQKLEGKDFSTIERFAPYDEYTNYLTDKLNGTTPEQEAIKEVKSEIEVLKAERQKEAEKIKQQMIDSRKKAVSELIAQRAEEFSSIKELQMEAAVTQHIQDSWEKDQVELTVEQAAKEVEELLVEQAQKWSGLTKVKTKVSTEAPKDTKVIPPVKQTIKTLTNSMAATGEIKLPKRSYADMSDTERYKAAAKAVLERQNINKG